MSIYTQASFVLFRSFQKYLYIYFHTFAFGLIKRTKLYSQNYKFLILSLSPQSNSTILFWHKNERKVKFAERKIKHYSKGFKFRILLCQHFVHFKHTLHFCLWHEKDYENQGNCRKKTKDYSKDYKFQTLLCQHLLHFKQTLPFCLWHAKQRKHKRQRASHAKHDEGYMHPHAGDQIHEPVHRREAGDPVHVQDHGCADAPKVKLEHLADQRRWDDGETCN